MHLIYSTMNIYVGNLPHATTNGELNSTFAAFGEVSSATVITDRETGDSRGFGFVEMPNKAEALEAMKQLNNSQLGGRALTVNEARPREERSGGGGGRSRY